MVLSLWQFIPEACVKADIHIGFGHQTSQKLINFGPQRVK